jgi:hypothetical protein
MDDDGYLKDDEQEAESLDDDGISEYLQDEEETDAVVSTADRRQDNINVKLPLPSPPIVIDLEADTGEEMVLHASATVNKQQDDVKQEEDAKTLRMKNETNTILSRAEHRQAIVKLPLPSSPIAIDLEADSGEEMDLEASATVDKQQDNIKQEQSRASAASIGYRFGNGY